MQVLTIIIPVFLLICIGKILKETHILSDDGIKQIKNMAVNVFLPVMAFDSLIHGSFSSDSIVLILIEIFILFAAFFIGFPLKKFFDKSICDYVPYALTTYEGGLFGWSLIAILVTQKNMFSIITMDSFSGIFVFTIMATGLKMLAGKKMSFKETTLSIITNPIIIAVILGFIGNAFQLGTKIDNSQFKGLYTTIINYLIQPLSSLILICIGSGLVLDKNILIKGLKLAFFRYLVQFILCALILFIISKTIGLTPVLKISLLMYMSVPTSFMLSMYATDKKAIEFTSSYLSLQILISLLIFCAISVYSNLNYNF